MIPRTVPSRVPMPSRTTINFLLDSLLLLLFLVLIWCSTVLQFVSPTSAGDYNCTLWGCDRSQWAAFQFGVLALFTLGVLVHLMLHWTWVCGVVAAWWGRWNGSSKSKLDDGTRTLIGVGALIVVFNIVGAAFALAALAIQRPIP